MLRATFRCKRHGDGDTGRSLRKSHKRPDEPSQYAASMADFRLTAPATPRRTAMQLLQARRERIERRTKDLSVKGRKGLVTAEPRVDGATGE